MYKCMACGHQFRAGKEVDADELWTKYMDNKQTVAELSAAYGLSESTIKRRLHDITKEWVLPPLSGNGFVHMDTTYWGHN